MDTTTKPVRRRHVFYVSGFDPRGPGHYHALYRDEAAERARQGGEPLQVGPRRRSSALSASWQVDHPAGDAEVRTTFEFLRWDDVIRTHWQRRPLRLLWEIVLTTLFYLRSGALAKMYRQVRPPLFVPFAVIFALLLLSPLLGLWAGLSAGAAGWHPLAALAAGLGVPAAAIWAFRAVDRRWQMLWLLRVYAFSAKQARDETPDLEARLDAFAQRIAEHLRSGSEADEVLIVGHSSGSIMAVSTLARALQIEPALARLGPPVALLTLGHCMPVLSLLPQARRFRGEMAAVAAAEGIEWVDFTAPVDSCCFALADIPRLCGEELARPPQRPPQVLSARFHTLFSPQRYRQVRRDKYRCHFQYLMASERPGPYDYFAITAGPQRLAQRFPRAVA